MQILHWALFCAGAIIASYGVLLDLFGIYYRVQHGMGRACPSAILLVPILLYTCGVSLLFLGLCSAISVLIIMSIFAGAIVVHTCCLLILPRIIVTCPHFMHQPL